MYRKLAKLNKISNNDSPYPKLLEKFHKGSDMEHGEMLQAIGYAHALNEMRKICTINDEEVVAYIKQYYTYLCNEYEWNELPPHTHDIMRKLVHEHDSSTCFSEIRNQLIGECPGEFSTALEKEYSYWKNWVETH